MEHKQVIWFATNFFSDIFLDIKIISLLLHPADKVKQQSGRSVARSSRHIWDVEVASSNLAAPTK